MWLIFLFQIKAVAGSTLLLKTSSSLIRSVKAMCAAAHRVSHFVFSVWRLTFIQKHYESFLRRWLLCNEGRLRVFWWRAEECRYMQRITSWWIFLWVDYCRLLFLSMNHFSSAYRVKLISISQSHYYQYEMEIAQVIKEGMSVYPTTKVLGCHLATINYLLLISWLFWKIAEWER